MFNPTYANCVAACRACITACQAWLDRAEASARPHGADLCRSSIRLCQLVIEELKLGSAFSIQVCALGTVICRACADECAAGHEPGDLDCATACLRAAEECHAVATMSPARAGV